jgi:outer membrane biosynthesis protein TonB
MNKSITKVPAKAKVVITVYDEDEDIICEHEKSYDKNMKLTVTDSMIHIGEDANEEIANLRAEIEKLKKKMREYEPQTKKRVFKKLPTKEESESEDDCIDLNKTISEPKQKPKPKPKPKTENDGLISENAKAVEQLFQ